MDIDLFVDEFCRANQLDLDKIKSNHRGKPYQDFRRILMFIMRNRYGMNLVAIKIYLNKKSHSCIIKALNVHDDLIKFNKGYRELYNKVK